MACNKMVWAFVGLCVLSLSITLSEAAPADQAGDQADQAGEADQAGDQAGQADQAGEADQTGEADQAGQADQADGQADEAGQANDQAAQADQADDQDSGRSNNLSNAAYEIIGIVIQTFLNNEQVGSILQRLPEKVRLAIINEIGEDKLKDIIKNKVTPEEAQKMIKALSEKGRGQEVFGEDFDNIAKGTAEEQLKAISNLKAESLSKLAEFDDKGLLGDIILAVDPNVVGREVAAHLNEVLQVLQPGDIKKAIQGIFKLFVGRDSEA